ncbi:hypothetical protein [Duganella sacchari]|uniref:hypothetical protein n=1 Tax=Duganella sacchari TaxID=551987 RepID=UPI00142F3329|nr:hypothetical protein [Duganella sacchari]
MFTTTFVSMPQWNQLFLNRKNAAFAARGNTFGGVETAKIICCPALFYNSEVVLA